MSDYSEFQDEIRDELNRSDLTSTQLDKFIDRAELTINRVLRVTEMYTTTTLTFSTNTEALPTDYLEARSVTITVGDNAFVNLLQLPPEALNQEFANHSSTRPKAYTIEGSNMRIAPGPDDDYDVDFNYYARPAAFTASVTPATYTAYQDLYLWAAARQASIFLRNDENTAKYDALFKSVLVDVKVAAESGRYGGNSLTMRNAPRF